MSYSYITYFNDIIPNTTTTTTTVTRYNIHKNIVCISTYMIESYFNNFP